MTQNWWGYKTAISDFQNFQKWKYMAQILSKKKFLIFFFKTFEFSQNAENMFKTSSRWAPVATSAWYLRKWLSNPLFHFSVYRLHYTTKIQMHVLACHKSCTRKQMVSLDFWAQTASDRHFLLILVTFKIWPFLPDLALTFS